MSALAYAPSSGSAQVGGTVEYSLSIEPVDVELIDGQVVYMLLYYDRQSGGQPRPVIRATEGQTVIINITNNAPEAHGFQIPSVRGASLPRILPGRTRTISFVAPVGGSYMYLDPTLAPVWRLMGLHGAFVVEPAGQGATPNGAPTPYSAISQTAEVRALFDSFGVHPRFPGKRWEPGGAKEYLWIFSSIDPALNRMIERGEAVDPTTVASWFLPRYFTINGLSGYDLESEPTVVPKGYQGEPVLIRTMNAGLATHSPHIHGNHVFQLSRTRSTGAVQVESNLLESDSWNMPPLERRDVLLPFFAPPDAPVWPPVEEPFPMRYVMHDHTEMSQTAGGGNYPQGMVTHWEMLGPLRNTAQV